MKSKRSITIISFISALVISGCLTQGNNQSVLVKNEIKFEDIKKAIDQNDQKKSSPLASTPFTKPNDLPAETLPPVATPVPIKTEAPLVQITSAPIVQPSTTSSKLTGRIAYTSNKGGVNKINIINAAGPNLKVLQTTTNEAKVPNWSKDSNKIVYQSSLDEAAGFKQIFIFNLETNKYVLISDNYSDSGSDVLRVENIEPNFTSNDSQISYLRCINSRLSCSVYSSNISTYLFQISDERTTILPKVNKIRLTDSKENVRNLKWSQIKQKFIYSSDKEGKFEIYSMSIDGSNKTKLTKNLEENIEGWEETEPSFSPDGKKILFVSNRDELALLPETEIFIMDANGC